MNIRSIQVGTHAGEILIMKQQQQSNTAWTEEKGAWQVVSLFITEFEQKLSTQTLQALI